MKRKQTKRKTLARRYGRTRATSPCTNVDLRTRTDIFNAICEHKARIFGVPFTPLPLPPRTRRRS